MQPHAFACGHAIDMDGDLTAQDILELGISGLCPACYDPVFEITPCCQEHDEQGLTWDEVCAMSPMGECVNLIKANMGWYDDEPTSVEERAAEALQCEGLWFLTYQEDEYAVQSAARAAQERAAKQVIDLT